MGPLEADLETRIHANIFAGITDKQVDKWDQERKEAKQGQDIKQSHEGDFGSILPRIFGNGIVTSQSFLNQGKHLNFCMCLSLVKGCPEYFRYYTHGKTVWRMKDSPVMKIQVLCFDPEKRSGVAVPPNDKGIECDVGGTHW